MKRIFIHHHLGLGDHFVCNGLVRTLLEREMPNFLYLPVKKQNIMTVSKMYSDDKRIICIPVENDQDVYQLPHIQNCLMYKIGFEKCRYDWDISFYDSVSLPIKFKWTKWKCNRDYEREKALEKRLGLTEPYILVHDSGSNGKYDLEIEAKERIIRIEPLTECLLDWCGVIEKAKQIHCIDSSVIHLAQSIRSNGTFHKIRKTGNQIFKIRDGWETKNYE